MPDYSMLLPTIDALIHSVNGISIHLDDVKKQLLAVRYFYSTEIDHSQLTPDQQEDFDEFESTSDYTHGSSCSC